MLWNGYAPDRHVFWPMCCYCPDLVRLSHRTLFQAVRQLARFATSACPAYGMTQRARPVTGPPRIIDNASERGDCDAECDSIASTCTNRPGFASAVAGRRMA